MSILKAFRLAPPVRNLAPAGSCAKCIYQCKYVSAQCRWPPVLSALLRDYRWKLTLTVPWQPMYKLLDASFMQAVSTYSGTFAQVTHNLGIM